MPKRVQDILPANKRSIREIPLDDNEIGSNSTRKKADKEKTTEIRIHKIEKTAERISLTPPTPKKGRKSFISKKWILIPLGIVIILAVAGFITSAYFSKATFTIIPRSIPVTVNGTYVAQATAKEGMLLYNIVTLSGSATTTMAAVDGPEISTKAQGKVTLYNSYSSQAVRLIAGTRLSDDSGRIYRLTSSIVIPGYTKSSSNTIPGTIVTDITADQAGDKYNISRSDSISDFKIVAYKGSPKYDSIYARLSSDVSGGFIGTKKIVSPQLVASTTDKLRSKILSTMLSQIKNAVPAGYIFYDNAYTSTFSNPLINGSSKNIANISLQGTLYGILFKETDLIETLAGDKAVQSFGNFAYSATNLDKLDFSITNQKDFSPIKKTALIVHMKGNINVIGTIPINEIKAKFAGSSLAKTQDLLKPYSAIIESGSGELIPPWAKVPTDPSRISVVIINQ